MGSFCWKSLILLHAIIKICMFNLQFLYAVEPVGRALRMLRWLTFRLLQSFLTFKDKFYANPYFMCDRMDIIHECFTYINMLSESVWLEKGHWCIHLFLLAKTLFMMYFYQQGWRLEWLWNFISISICESSYMFCKVPNSILLLVNVRTFICYLYTC